MDKLERDQVRLILERLSSETLRITKDKQKAMHADHSARGLLRSGATVKIAVQIIEEQASHFVEAAVDDVAAVAQDMDAFVLISSSLTAVFRGYEAHLAEAIRLATGGGDSASHSVKVAGEKLFSEMRNRVFKQLEIHRFSFVKPSKGDLAAQRERIFRQAPMQPHDAPKRNPGGKILAKHWDAMWSDIAVQLWAGDLDPKSQADIKRAMFDWLNGRGIEAGDTAVTERARALWQRMQTEE